MWIYRRKGRDDVRVGNITVSVETKTKTLLPNGVSGGRNSWKLVEESIVYTVSWNETTSRWEFRSLIGETDTLLYSSLSDDLFSDPTPGAVVDPTISKDSTWDYRAFDHDWMLVYNYKERRWSTRSPDGMLSFYNNEYPVSAFNVIDDFSSVWTNSRTLTAPVTMNDYPWRQLVFTAQARSSNVVTVTSAAHGLTSGNKINVLGSTPTSFNGSLVPVTVTDVDTFTYPSTGTDETLSGTAIGDSDFRTIDGAWQYLSFPSRLLVGRENDVALYEGGDFTDGQGNETYVEVKSHELFFGSLTDAKEIKAVKLSYTKVGNPDIRMQVGTRDNLNEPIYWTSERLQQTLALDKESRFVFDFDLRSKFFTFRFRVFNTPTDYVDEFMGGSIEVTGMKSKGTEL